MKGVCCECQAMQDIYFDNDIGTYLMESHDIPGITIWCKGTDSMPQAIININENENEKDN